MNKRFLKNIVLVLTFYSCQKSEWNTKTLQALLTDIDRHSYFLSIRVEGKNITNRYVISNLDLYRYFKYKQGFNPKQYEDYMRSVLVNDQALLVDDTSLKNFQFVRIVEKCSVADENPIDILNKNFHKVLSNYVIKEGITQAEVNCLIDALFRKKVISVTDDESGYLLIPEWQFTHK